MAGLFLCAVLKCLDACRDDRPCLARRVVLSHAPQHPHCMQPVGIGGQRGIHSAQEVLEGLDRTVGEEAIDEYSLILIGVVQRVRHEHPTRLLVA